MSVPVWFVVERFHGRLYSALCYERLPTKYMGLRAKANGLVTAIRVDTRPHLAGRSRAELHEIWELLDGLDRLDVPAVTEEVTERAG